jgi:hypothetical protein
MVMVAGCQRAPQNAFVAQGPLPPPPTGTLKFEGTPPAHPFTKAAGGYYARTVFESDGPGNSHIEVRDVLIPPHAKSAVAALRGPAVFELITGEVSLTTGGRAEAMGRMGMGSLPAGKVLELQNLAPRPAVVRLYVILAR